MNRNDWIEVDAMQSQAILLIHGQQVGWADIRTILHAFQGIALVVEATTWTEAVALAAAYHPQLILTSTVIDAVSTAPILASIRAGPCPASTIGIFTNEIGPDAEFEAIVSLGISGYFIWRDLSYATLRSCLTALLAGELLLASRSATQAFLSILRRRNVQSVPLTARESAVLLGLADGLGQKEIAARLGVSERTVRTIIARLQQRLDAETPFTLGMKASQLGLIP